MDAYVRMCRVHVHGSMVRHRYTHLNPHTSTVSHWFFGRRVLYVLIKRIHTSNSQIDKKRKIRKAFHRKNDPDHRSGETTPQRGHIYYIYRLVVHSKMMERVCCAKAYNKHTFDSRSSLAPTLLLECWTDGVCACARSVRVIHMCRAIRHTSRYIINTSNIGQ